MEIQFRKAIEADIEGIIELCNECFNENTSLEYARQSFENTKNDSNQIYLVGIMENRIVAHLKITVIPTMYEDMNTYAILNHVCVKPEYRRHNIATKMLEEATEICREMKCKKIELWSKNFRMPAHACYKKYGFVADDSTFFYKEI